MLFKGQFDKSFTSVIYKCNYCFTVSHLLKFYEIDPRALIVSSRILSMVSLVFIFLDRCKPSLCRMENKSYKLTFQFKYEEIYEATFEI